MALKKLDIDGYGQIELNNVAFRRDGRIEAQCALDETDFADTYAENGMLLAVDKANRTIKFVTTGTKDLPVAVLYATEHLYDERTPGLKNFKLERGTFYPRMGYLAKGDLYTTNTVSYDTSIGADDDEFYTTIKGNYKTTTYYGGTSEDGRIAITTTKPTGVVLKVVEVYTMPDGQPGFKFQVLEA